MSRREKLEKFFTENKFDFGYDFLSDIETRQFIVYSIDENGFPEMMGCADTFEEGREKGTIFWAEHKIWDLDTDEITTIPSPKSVNAK